MGRSLLAVWVGEWTRLSWEMFKHKDTIFKMSKCWMERLFIKLFKIKMPWSVPRESYSRYVAGPDTGVLWDTKKTWPEDVLFEDHHYSILLRSERCGAISVSHSVMPDSLQPHGPAVHQAPLSKGSSKQGYWSGCHVLLWWSNEVTQKTGTGWLGELIWYT